MNQSTGAGASEGEQAAPTAAAPRLPLFLGYSRAVLLLVGCTGVFPRRSPSLMPPTGRTVWL